MPLYEMHITPTATLIQQLNVFYWGHTLAAVETVRTGDWRYMIIVQETARSMITVVVDTIWYLDSF